MIKRLIGKMFSILTSITLVFLTAAVPASAKATVAQYIVEDFTGGTAGQSLNGFNGWTSTVQAWSGNQLDAAVTIGEETSSNLYMLYTKTDAVQNSQDVTASKQLSEGFTGGIIKAKFSVMRGNTDINSAIVQLSGTKFGDETKDGWLNLTLNFSGGNVYFGSQVGKTNYSFKVGEWNDFEMAYDTVSRKVALLQNGKYIINFVPCGTDGNMVIGSTVTAIAVKTDRKTAVPAGKTGFFGIDNIEVINYTDNELISAALTDVKKTLGNNALTSNVSLPTTGMGGVSLTWTSSNPDVITNKGVVTVSDESKTAVLTLDATCGETTVQKNYNVIVAGRNDIFSENFDLQEADEGTRIEALGGWEITEGNPVTADTEMKVKLDGENRVLSVLHTGSSSEKYVASQTFPNVSDSNIKLSLRMKRINEEAKAIRLRFGGINFGFRFADRKVWSDNGEFTVISLPEIPVGQWKTYEIYMDFDKQLLTFSVDGTPAVFNAELKGSLAMSSDEFEIDTVPNVNLNGAELYIDDISITKSAGYQLNVCGFEFKDSLGHLTADRTNGGSVSSVTVSAKRDIAKAAVLVVVYDADGRVYSCEVKEINSEMHFGNSVKVPLTNVFLPKTGAENAVVKAFVLGNTLSALQPVSATLSYTRPSTDKITLYILGDSISANYSARDYPQTGFGQVIGNFFDSNKVTVRNLAVGGRSSKSFFDEKRFQKVIKDLKIGDYVFIMFGHNDTHADDRHTDPYTTYKEYLTRYVTMARSRGAVPILMTPITVRSYTNGVLEEKTLGDYPDAMRQLAVELGVPLIDNYQFMQDKLNEVGETGSKDYYMYIEPNDPRYASDAYFAASKYASITTTHNDTIHITKLGANTLASFVVDKIAELGLPLSAYISE